MTVALPQDPIPVRRGNSIRVLVPADAAFNLEKMRTVTANLMARLGCPACHSGFSIRFIQERDFVVNSKLEVVGR